MSKADFFISDILLTEKYIDNAFNKTSSMNLCDIF